MARCPKEAVRTGVSSLVPCNGRTAPRRRTRASHRSLARSLARLLAGVALAGTLAGTLAGCTGTNLDGGLTATGLTDGVTASAASATTAELGATTTVAAATPDGPLPPAAIPGAPEAAADAGAADGTGAADTDAADTREAVERIAAAAAAPLPPASVPGAMPTTAASLAAPLAASLAAPASRAERRERSFRPLALASVETRRERRDAFRARAERANLVRPDRRADASRGERNRKRRVRIVRPSKGETRGALPGVRSRSSLFQIGKVESNAAADSFRVASAAGLARLSANGLRKQTAHVKTECFKPDLIAVLKRAEAHFGRPVMVTSGYRSPKGNRRAGGAKSSKHISCEAADFQIEGVSKWTLAKYLRSLPGRGGVGTYCHTQSVHYDIGSERDWNWGCRKR